MKAVGLIVEYNPFHNGHKYHLEKAMEVTASQISIAIMSGNYLQRGEPALVNKWLRTEMALSNGVDIVVELPSFYSTGASTNFAFGAIQIANELGIDTIVFGSELGEIELLTKMAKIQVEKNKEFEGLIKKHMDMGLSYPNAINNAYEEYFGMKGILNPNNILGIEYIKAIIESKSSIKAETIKREKVDYHENFSRDKIASASGIRKMLEEGRYEEVKEVVPAKTYEILMENLDKLSHIKDMYSYIRYTIIRDKDRLRDIQDMEEGLWNRFYNCAKEAKSYDEFMEKVVSKRYTISRIKRILIHILLGIEEVEVKKAKEKLPYIRILGYSKKGAKYLKNLKKERDLEYIISLKNAEKIVYDKSYLDRELDRDMIYKDFYDYEDEKFAIIYKGD